MGDARWFCHVMLAVIDMLSLCEWRVYVLRIISRCYNKSWNCTPALVGAIVHILHRGVLNSVKPTVSSRGAR